MIIGTPVFELAWELLIASERFYRCCLREFNEFQWVDTRLTKKWPRTFGKPHREEQKSVRASLTNVIQVTVDSIALRHWRIHMDE